jgi:hypothetical protein
MTITARWADLAPGDTRPTDHHVAVVSSPDDDHALVDRLTKPNTSEAHLVHNDRPTEFNELFGEDEPDHQVVIGVWRGFGYMEFIDSGHYAQLTGDPTSPEWHTTSSDHFRRGSGVPPDTLAAAIIEFLTTRDIPICVTWTEHRTSAGTESA